LVQKAGIKEILPHPSMSAFALAVKFNAVKMKRFASNVAIATG